MDSLKVDEIMLHPEADSDGVMLIKDQHGRILRGVRAITFSSGMDKANELTIVVLAGVERGGMTNSWANRKKSNG